MWSDTLTTQEAEHTMHAMNILKDVEWTRPLTERCQKAGGINSENMPLLFEVRFAYELHRAGVVAEYEYKTGVGDSSVEFRVQGSPEWLIELVSIRPSEAVKRATRKTGLIYEMALSTAGKDSSQTEEAEMITVEQKIGEKVCSNENETKFPIPTSAIHVIVTDVRGYLDSGGDIFDYRQMAYGAAGVPSELSWMIHYWEIERGKREPIRGLFERSNPLRAARLIQERIHFLGFVRERAYREGEIQEIAYYLANPHLFSSEAEAVSVFVTYPLKP